MSSPRTWGCFLQRFRLLPLHLVFPTHVGVFLCQYRRLFASACLPHARGGVSQAERYSKADRASSPRTWGCFFAGAARARPAIVFPTHVGVFLACCTLLPAGAGLPHARGGVSGRLDADIPVRLSSPRTWGCFRTGALSTGGGKVFPTHVGVFPRIQPTAQARPRLPHARGGVSATSATTQAHVLSSPRTWGCFSCPCAEPDTLAVFPTHVGVFLRAAWWSWRRSCLPHARGGVSP